MAYSESGAQASPHETGSDAQGQGDVARALSKMLRALDDVLACAPVACSAALETGPLSRTMAAVLANIGPHQSLQVLNRLSVSALPGRHQVLDGLMTPAQNDFGKVLYLNTRAQHRQALLASIFSPERVQALAKACRVLTKETT